MQLGEAQKGLPGKSELFDSLKVYLDNKKRLQPIIGLGSIIECVKADTYNREALYMCEVCICRLSKADMRNHIMGSLHRYNYIKSWHPHLTSGWKENSNLSRLAWPLMDLAKVLERNEGPGDVQLLEVEDDLYQKMATYSENDAITLMSSVRDGQGDGEAVSSPEAAAVHFDHSSSQSNRMVLLSKNQWRRSEKSSRANMTSHKTPNLLHPTVAPRVISDGGIKTISASEFNNTQVLSEPCVLSGSSNCFLDGYTGTKPLIGLFRVVECRSEDGCTYCFLCHCCRIRSNKKHIIDHLTSSSHLINYLMETRPEQVELMTAAVNENCEFLQSLAEKVEQEEGRGELKVLKAPESLCILLTGKSYHWCIKMLCKDTTFTNTNSQPKKVVAKGTSVKTTTVQGVPEKHAVAPSKCAQKMKVRRKKRRVTNTVFKVNLPLTKGAVLLERTSFSEDNRPLSSTYSPSADQDFIPLPESQTEDFELDSDTGSLAVNNTEHTPVSTTSQHQRDLYNEDGGTGQPMGQKGNLTVTLYHQVDGYLSDDKYFSQSEDVTGTRDQTVYAEGNYNRPQRSQERASSNFYEDLNNKCLQGQNEGLAPAVSHTQDWTYYNPINASKEGHAEQWYNAASPIETSTGVEVLSEDTQKTMGSDATRHHYQHQPQYTAQDCASLGGITGSVWHHGLVPHLDVARVSTNPYLGEWHAHSASAAPEPGTQFNETEHINVPKAPQSYTTQPMSYQAVQVGYGVLDNHNYTIRPGTNNYQHIPYPVSGGSGTGGMFQSNAYIQPRQASYYGAHSDVNMGATALSGLTISGSDNGTVHLMRCNSQYEFCI